MKGLLIIFAIPILLYGYSCKSSRQTTQVHPIFNHLFLYVANLDSSIKFYTTAFDLGITERFTELDITQSDTSFKRQVKIVFLKFPEQDFVYELAERTSAINISGVGVFQHVGVEVKDIDVAFQRVLNAGGKVYIPVRTVSTNSGLRIKQAFFKGPDDEQIELVQVISGGY